MLRPQASRQITEPNHTSTARFMMQGQRETTELSERFFSKQNIAQLQKGIRDGVMRRCRVNLGDQDERNLLIVMQHVFFEEAHYLEADINAQVNTLNTDVLKYCIYNVCKNYQHYVQYRKDMDAPPSVMERPTYMRADKTLEFKGWF